MKKSSPSCREMFSSLLHGRRQMLLVGSLLLLLLALTVSIIRPPSFLTLFGLSSLPPAVTLQVDDGNDVDTELMRVAALASEETTSGKFRSGGLGLSRTDWEVLHGTPESPGPDIIVYQDNSYKVTYRQNLVWQIEKSWGKTNLVPQQARARIRRYLPLDSHLAETIEKSTDTIVDVYRSHMLSQLLSPQPPEPSTKKRKHRPKEIPTERCIVVHRLSKQTVISSLLHIGDPKPEGYFLPQSQTPPTKTMVREESERKEAAQSDPPKTTTPKSRTQGQS